MRFLSFGFILFVLSGLIYNSGFSQTATIVNNGIEPKHETFSQRVISVLFDDGAGGSVTLTGSTPTTDWTVEINGTPVTVTGATILSNRVTVTFDATALNGVAYVLPGQVVEISFNNSGSTLQTGVSFNPAANFTGVTSNNNFAFTCSELIFFKQEAYSNVDVCSPVVMDFYQYAYKLSLRFRNSSNFDINDFDFNVIWGDADITVEAPYLSDQSGTPDGAYFDNTGFTGSNPAVLLTARPIHNYPAANPTDCSFNFSLVPSVSGLICNSISTTTLFATYDNDNANSGTLSLVPDVPGTDRVCLGTNVNMIFSDETNLNCRAAIEPILPNDQTRYIRIVYGSSDYDAPGLGGVVNNIPDIRVAGVPVTNNDASGSLIFPAGYFPTGVGGIGVPDFNGVIELASPVTAATATTYMQQITTTLTNNQQEGQRFNVRLDYWDICNAYDPSDPDGNVVSIETYVEIITTPVSPVVTTSPFCENDLDASFELTATGVAGTYDWYRDAGPVNNLQTGNDNTFNPVTEGPIADRINKTVAASTVFHRYVTVTTANGCTSLPTDVVIQIDDTNIPGSIGHPLGASPITICSGTDPVAFTNVASASGGDGTPVYQWQSSADNVTYNDIGGATTAIYDPPSIATSTYFRRRVRSGACTEQFSNVIRFIAYQPTGTVSGGGSICQATPAPPVQFTFSGAGPWDMEYAIDGVTQPIVNNILSSPYLINSPAAGVYTIASLIDVSLSCAAPPANLTGSASVVNSAVNAPTVDSFSVSAAVCDDAGATVPPTATLDLDPAANYDFTYDFNGVTHVESNVPTDGTGQIIIAPPYSEWGNAPGSYNISITSLKNTVTGCAGVVPINSLPLVVNARPATASGAVNATACDSPGNGVALSVSDPDPTNTLDLAIAWSTNGPALAAFSAVVPANGIVSGANNSTFTPVTSANSTYYGFVQNVLTGCVSSTGLAVTQTQETMPAGNAGPDQPGICIDNPSATMASTSSGGVGSWSVPGIIAYYQNFDGFANGTTSSGAANGWTRDVSDPQSFTGGQGYFSVQTGRFESDNTNGSLGSGVGNLAEVVWMSPVISISGMSSVQATVDLYDLNNNLDGGGDGDYVRVYFKLDGGGETLFNSNGSFLDDFANSTATAFAAPITGSTLQIIIRISTNGSGERIAFDNVIIKDPSSSIAFNNPNSTNAVVSNLPVPPGAAPVTTTLRWTVVAPLGACRLEDDVTITVNVLPTSSAIPTQILCDDTPGAPVQVTLDLNTYNASVTDAASVQWFTDALRTAPFLITGTVNVTNGTTYYWKGTNAAGCSNIGQVMFTIEPLPQATDQNYEFCEADATGIDLTSFEPDITTGTTDVEWFEDDGSGGLGTPIDDPGTPLLNEETNYTIAVTKTVYARVTNTSSTAVPQCFDVAAVNLKYKPKPLDNTITGDDVLCKGPDVKVYQVDPSINSYGTIHTYTWTITGSSVFEVFENGTGFTSTSSYTTTTNDFLIIVKFPNAGSFTITAKETIDGCDGDVSSFNVSVSDIPPALTFSSPDVVVCKNESVTYSLTTTNSSTYSWSVVGGSFSSASSGVGLTTVTITWGTVTSPQPNVSVQETNTSGCAGAPASENITIQDIPVMTQNLDAVVCNNEVSGIIFSTTGSSAPASSYTISSITVDPGLSTAANVTPRTVTNVNEIAGDRFVNATDDPLTVSYSIIPISSANCSGALEEIVLTIEPEVDATIINSTPSRCSSTAVQIALQSTTNPTSGDIAFNYTTNASSALIAGFLPLQNNLANGFIITDNLVNNDNQPGTLTYSITPVAQNAKLGNGCFGNPTAIIVSIEPKPKVTITPNTATVCEGVPLAFDLSTNTLPSSGNVVFQILGTPVVTGGVTGASSNGTFYNNGDDLADVLNNPTTLAQTVTYSLRPEAPGVSCVGDVAQVSVTVNPKPIVTPATTSQQICSGSNVNINLTFDVSNSTGFWTPNSTNVLGSSIGAGSVLFQTLFNNSTNQGNVVYSVVPKSPAGCDGPPVTITIGVDPTPDVVITPSTQTVCNGAQTNIALTSAVTGTGFNWTVIPSGTSITGASNGSGSSIVQTLQNTDVIPGTIFYEVTPTGPVPTSCPGTPKTAFITVAPTVGGEFLTDDAAVCKGTPQFLMMGFTGQAPFTISYNDGASDVNVSNVGNIFVKQISPATTSTYTIKSVTDANGCVAQPVNETVTITVGEASAAFSVLDPVVSCSPHKAQFKYNQVAGTTYTWRWFDGNADSVYQATSNVPEKIITHSFINPSSSGTISYHVNLVANLDASLGGCTDIKKQTVSVYPRVAANVFPDRTTICSGETVYFSNQALGASSHRWFYREQGNSQEIDVRSVSNASYQLINTSTQNPIVYEVVYRGDNANCPAEKIMPITVYRGVNGSIDEGTIPPFTGGQTIVSFTNTSTPLDGSDFRYEWEFGSDSNPETFTGSNDVIPVTYTSPGIKEITLKITNTRAVTNGLQCINTIEKNITILLPPLVAGFKITPFASCFPADIEVVENTSTGDIFKWKVVDLGGNIAATALAPKPTFRIANPGTYDVFLETTNSITGQQAFATVEGIEVYDAPVAVFEVRPTTVFVPDTELITFNRSSEANFYEWNFGDGTITNDFEPNHTYTLEGKYTITLVAAYDHGQKDIDRDGILDENVVCADTTTSEVTARQGGVTRIPNAFTPSANGPSGGNPGSGTFNDVFLPITKGIEEFQMQIYDRWGTMVFESKDKNQGWDGYDRNKNLLPSGVYVYKLTLRLADGNRTTQIGDVTLIR